LIDAEEKRIRGDYGVQTELAGADAIEQIDRTRQFIEVAEQLINPMPPTTGDKT